MTTLEDKSWSKYYLKPKIITIDPGKAGGIAVYSVEDGAVIALTTMPETPTDLFNFLKRYAKNSRVYMELVGGLPKMGGSAMFNFGKGFGHLEMALLACKIPTYEVIPQKWQKALTLGVKGNKSTTEWKNKLKAKAEQMFPNVGKITLSVSDALLICQYGIMEEKNK